MLNYNKYWFWDNPDKIINKCGEKIQEINRADIESVVEISSLIALIILQFFPESRPGNIQNSRCLRFISIDQV